MRGPVNDIKSDDLEGKRKFLKMLVRLSEKAPESVEVWDWDEICAMCVRRSGSLWLDAIYGLRFVIRKPSSKPPFDALWLCPDCLVENVLRHLSTERLKWYVLTKHGIIDTPTPKRTFEICCVHVLKEREATRDRV